ncbi:protein of unknown function (plasmid) [Candidatus Methylocalor cossyra]|uniref:Uncharacterized protein n=1 Tax=Candidatus Methylocalor cossyra TaxID=3108543 RepID=A0ABM9NMW7_9GAMM
MFCSRPALPAAAMGDGAGKNHTKDIVLNSTIGYGCGGFVRMAVSGLMIGVLSRGRPISQAGLARWAVIDNQIPSVISAMAPARVTNHL